MLSIFFINDSFATTTHNLYDARGNVVALCDESGACRYVLYQGVHQQGSVVPDANNEENSYNRIISGPTDNIAEINQTSGTPVTTWLVSDFHNSTTAKQVEAAEGNEENDPTYYSLDAFGNLLNLTQDQGCEAVTFTDKHRIGCTGLSNFNARFYDSAVGRFDRPDPIAQANLNWFVGFNNNPLSFVDPTGMAAKDINVDVEHNQLQDAASQKVMSYADYTNFKSDMENKGVSVKGDYESIRSAFKGISRFITILSNITRIEYGGVFFYHQNEKGEVVIGSTFVSGSRNAETAFVVPTQGLDSAFMQDTALLRWHTHTNLFGGVYSAIPSGMDISNASTRQINSVIFARANLLSPTYVSITTPASIDVLRDNASYHGLATASLHPLFFLGKLGRGEYTREQVMDFVTHWTDYYRIGLFGFSRSNVDGWDKTNNN